MPLARQLANWAAGATCPSLPEPVRHEARRAFVNVLGCMIGGSRHEAVTVALAALGEHSGRRRATVIGRKQRTDMLLATLLNGMSASAFMFDDTHAEAIVHPSAPVAAALLALAEHRTLSGEGFIAAFVAGVETICRLSKALSVRPADGITAWIQSAVTGGIGAAVAAGKVLGLSPDSLVHAIATAASTACGYRAVSGSMCSPMLTGHVAQNGLRSALLAAQGFRSAEGSLEAADGFAAMFSARADLSAVTEGLGARFEILSNTYKPFPCGIVIHPVIEACLVLGREGLDAAAVQAITISANPAAAALTGRPHPVTPLEAQVSLHHWAAVALAHGTAGLDVATQARIGDPLVVALRGRIAVDSRTDIGRTAAGVMVVLTDGRRLQHSIDPCIGSRERPMSDGDIEEKLRTLARDVIEPRAVERILRRCRRLAEVADVGMIARAAA